jgi:Rhodopirellula transposase DDE domain
MHTQHHASTAASSRKFADDKQRHWPGTSKWNQIEHRLFCHITRTWRGRPLMTAGDAVAGIAATTTYAGLKVTAVLDQDGYPDGIKISDERMRYLEDRILDRQEIRGEWNYAVRAAPAPAGPEPEPAPAAPGPDLEALAALAGISDLPALLAAVEVPWQAAREQRLHLDRGAARTRNSGGMPWKLPFGAIVTAAACHQRLRMPFRLLEELLGVHESTISLATRRVTPLLAAHGITPRDGGTRISTLDELHKHAAAAGITLTTGHPAASQAKSHSPQARHAQS